MKTAIILLLAIVCCAQARLGESNVDIGKRYGAVQQRVQISTNEWKGTYKFKEYIVWVEFTNDISVCEVIVTNDPRKMDDAEVQSLIKSAGGDAGEWVRGDASLSKMSKVWINTETKVQASATDVGGRGAVAVMTKERFEKEEKGNKLKQKQKSDGSNQ